MPRTRTVPLRFPVGGVTRRHGYADQPQPPTPSALNVWPGERSTGRTRGGVRSGLSSLGSISADPYGWCDCVYNDGGAQRRVAVVHASGTSTSAAGSSWTSVITTDPGTDFCSCAVYLSTLYMARGGGTTLYQALSGTGAGTALSNGGGGTAPTNCGIIISALDRLWLAGDTSNPNNVYACRIGDPPDWDYAAVDQGGAYAINGTNGVLNGAVTSLIHHGDNCIIVGYRDAMDAIVGNPRAGGSKRTINQMHGPVSQTAWCKDEINNTWFLSRAGLYKIASGCISDGSNIQSVSRERLPASLHGIDPGGGDRVSLGYDLENRGLHIYVDKATGTDEYWFYDTNDGGFWPMEFPTTMHLACILPPVMGATTSSLLAINSSGSVYQFSDTQTTDNGTAIDSHLYLGPIPLGSPTEDGILQEVQAALASTSGNLAWSVYAGQSAEEAYNDTPWFTGQNWTIAGLNHTQHPQVRGHACYLKLEDVSGSRWSFEEINCTVAKGGPRRVY